MATRRDGGRLETKGGIVRRTGWGLDEMGQGRDLCLAVQFYRDTECYCVEKKFLDCK